MVLHRNDAKNSISELIVFMKNNFHETFFQGPWYQWGYRGSMIENKIFNLEKTFSSLKLVVFVKSSIGLVGFINGGTHEWW